MAFSPPPPPPPPPPPESSQASSSCPSSAFYSATQSPSSFSLSPSSSSSPSASLAPFVEHLHGDRRARIPAVSASDRPSPFPAKRFYDVFLGFCGAKARPLLRRFVRWLCAELEMHGISCFASDAAACRTAASRGAAREAAAAASFGVVIVAEESLANRCSIEEMHGFLERGS
uniref:TIR domain-containing protein n=1 Tax=Ananas comosus var. bracteatus TaxID=296719 RepID=A0A6V7NFJ2_ANACO|nr:unnamed protein product [Ananas comosus var. bracteatus]